MKFQILKFEAYDKKFFGVRVNSSGSKLWCTCQWKRELI